MVAAHRGERGVEIYRIDRHQRADRVVVDLGAIARSDMRGALCDAFLDLARCVGEQIIVHQIILMDAEQPVDDRDGERSEEHTSELQSLMRISYAVFCLKKKKHTTRMRKSPVIAQ